MIERRAKAIASENSEIRRLVITRSYSSVWTNLVGRCKWYTSTEAAPRPALVRAASRCALLNGKFHAHFLTRLTARLNGRPKYDYLHAPRPWLDKPIITWHAHAVTLEIRQGAKRRPLAPQTEKAGLHAAKKT